MSCRNEVVVGLIPRTGLPQKRGESSLAKRFSSNHVLTLNSPTMAAPKPENAWRPGFLSPALESRTNTSCLPGRHRLKHTQALELQMSLEGTGCVS